MGNKGSHGKIKWFTVTQITILNTATNARRWENANYSEKLGKIPSHGNEPDDRTQADAERVAEEYVILRNDEEIVDIVWGHHTKK
ncbi:hypothetical protein ULMS_19630 [Patiriisocius marinistellae]|uniref:Uncharacterized protein n=1 Tax=Patiriisocius marinistellae TaxID=2494560 RepID=A0A5J4G1T1_9FLAO|nr:hypothetical protein [Patiriisocius marinistellae]GEQ86455.1 hypothetical protein ULMS_19630 [Patiriisocius marinistellae]